MFSMFCFGFPPDAAVAGRASPEAASAQPEAASAQSEAASAHPEAASTPGDSTDLEQVRGV